MRLPGTAVVPLVWLVLVHHIYLCSTTLQLAAFDWCADSGYHIIFCTK